MPIAKDVKEVVDLCRSLGLDPVRESGSGHYKVRDPKSGTYLFGISSSPSDPNWRWMIMRHLRRLGLIRKGGGLDGKRGKKKYRSRPVIDIHALKLAQDRAASHGERIPTLDDLEDSTEFFSRIKVFGTTSFSAEAQEEAINLMAAADAPRINAARQRLIKLLDARREELQKMARARSDKVPPHTGEYAMLTRIAMEEVAPARGLRSWVSHEAGAQAIRSFVLSNSKPRLWAVELIEATIDHIEGLKFGVIDESRRTISVPPEREIPLRVISLPEEETPEPELVTLTVESTDSIRERYAETLLEILSSQKEAASFEALEPILNRLDKLTGI
jgi:hypothetical protein